MIQPLKEEDEVGETVKRTLLFPAPPRDSSTSTVDDARVSLSHLSEFNIESLRALNGALFPVSYNDRFYRDLLGTYPSDLSLLGVSIARMALYIYKNSLSLSI